MRRRQTLAGGREPRVRRYALPIADSRFDPPAITDVYSRTVITHVFEGRYRCDHLARPARLPQRAGRRVPR